MNIPNQRKHKGERTLGRRIGSEALDIASMEADLVSGAVGQGHALWTLTFKWTRIQPDIDFR